MEHVVFYPSAEGAPSFRRVGSLDDAVTFVEHLRNVENITEFSVHELTAVPLAFRAYYRVEVPAAEVAPADVVSAPPAAAPQPIAEPPADEDRAAEWVAAAAVIEPPVAAPPAAAPVESVPAAPEPAAAEAAVAAVTAPVAVAASTLSGPFADAPPVTPAAEEFGQDTAPPAATDVLPEHDDAAGAPAPGGRRSMGFFTR
jgi:hypothetical protein